MGLVWRIIVIAFAALAASMAAGFVVMLAALAPALSVLELGPLDHGAYSLILGFGTIFVSGFALLPALAAIAVAEAAGIRSVLYYAAGGAIIAALLYLNLSNWDMLVFQVNGFARREIEIMAAAGIAAGFVYWAIAGRRSGAWRRGAHNAALPPSA